MIGFWATLSLNIPDFSRYARSQRDQIVGQALGLPLTMALYSFIGVAVTSATTIIYGETIWDPVDVLTHFTNPVVLVVAMLALCIATLATNIAANVVSPANDFAHLAPRKISFRIGGLITGVIGVLMMPWKLVADPSGYIFTWLVGYSALLGPIGGIMIADYFVCRQRQLERRQRFISEDGRISFHQWLQHRGADRAARRRPAESARFSRHGEIDRRRRACRTSSSHSTITRGSSDSRSRLWFISLLAPHLIPGNCKCSITACQTRHETPELPPFDHQPQKYTGPSADEVLRCASNS